MMARRVFYSFHYEEDRERVAQVRNMGVIEGSRIASDNDWEEIKRGGDRAIKNWIDDQMQNTSCCVVLIGRATAGRKWVEYEISEAWKQRKGVVGVHIYELKNLLGQKSSKGQNPFNRIILGSDGIPLSSIAKTYDPPAVDSRDVYAHIKLFLPKWIEEAIQVRARYI
jgi:hypothetical protein